MRRIARPRAPSRLERRGRLSARGFSGWLLIVSGIIGLGLSSCKGTAASTKQPQAERIVSLAPAITDTLFAIGAGPQVVAVSNYCTYPPQVLGLPKAGSGITPQYEDLARLNPSLILTEKVQSVRLAPLRAIARTELLPWLSLDEVTSGIEKVGRLTGHLSEARSLATRLHQRLSVPAPSNAPRVLLVLGSAGKRLSEIWYIRKNSLHGAALRAAGGKNAVAHDVSALPRMSLSELVRTDPDMIIVLYNPGTSGEKPKLDAWMALTPLRAVKQKRVSVLEAPEAYANGPRILKLVDKLAREIRRLKEPR